MQRDIDQIITLVHDRLPSVDVVQIHKTHPADDDGLWWFRLPGVSKDIHLESSNGMCPFIVEHDDMRSSTDAWRATSVEEAAEAVVEYLTSLFTPEDR